MGGTLQGLSFFLPILLGLGVISSWVSRRRTLSLSFLTAAVALSFFLGAVTLQGLTSLLAGGVLIYIYYACISHPILKIVLGCVITVLAMMMYLHWMPGFHNTLIFKDLTLAGDSAPYRFYLNLDKISMGLFFLIFGVHLSRTSKEWQQSFLAALIPLALSVAVLWALSVTVHYVRFDPKIPAITLSWCVLNFLFVVIIEEAFFRGFLQHQLSLAFKKIPQGTALAVLLSSTLFGAIHYRGGTAYIGLSIIAGCIYGYAYARYRRLESAIFTHFGLNFVHFLFFSYPALIQ